MLSFDGINHTSIMVLDKASFHHSNIITLLSSAGILTIWLPPYSPDYNPIEEAFSYVKYYLRHHESIVDVASLPVILTAAFESIEKQQCLGWIRDCGYT